MPDQEFKLLITGDASSAVAATQQAGAATQKLKVDTTGLNDETKRMQGVAETATDGTKKLGEETEKTSNRTEGGGREMRRLANELGNMAGFADAGALTMGKMGAAVFGVGLAIELLKTNWAEMQEAAKGHINLEVKGTDAATIKGLADAYTTFADALKKTREAQTSPDAVAARDIAQLQNKLKLLQEILKAEETEQLANLALQKDHMSPQAYDAAEKAIRDKFAGKETQAGFDERQAEIDRKKKEADELAKKSADEKAAGEHAAGRGEVLNTAQENANAAAQSIKEIQAQMEFVKNLHDQVTGKASLPQYEGATGKLQEAQDLLKFGRMAGRDGNYDSVMAGLEQQLAQAKSAIATGAIAASQEKAGKDATQKAGEDNDKSEKLRQQIDDEQKKLDEDKKTYQGTKAIGDVTSALGQEHAAEGNNTPQGYKDAINALNAGNAAAAEVHEALKTVGNSNKELHDALAKALADQQAENQRIIKILRNNGFNTH